MKNLVFIISLILTQLAWSQSPQSSSGNSSNSSGQVCEFLNHKEYSDLMTTIGGLQEAVSKIPKDCGEQVTQNAYQEAKNLQDSASKISEYWNSQALMAQDPLAFGNSVQSAVTSVRSLANNISRGSLNQVCANHFKSNQGMEFFSKLSDVGLSLGPMLILAKAMGAAISTPVVVGVIGVSSVANITTELLGRDEIQIADPEQQKKILKAVCDYRRAKKQMDYLMFIQDSVTKIDQKSEEVDLRIKKIRASLPEKYHGIFDLYNEGRTMNSKRSLQLEKANIWTRDFFEILNRDPSDNFQCTAAKSLLSSQDPHALLAIQEYQLQKRKDVPSLAAATLFKTSQEVMNEVMSNNSSDVKSLIRCASDVKKWRGLYSSLLRELYQINEKNVENEMNKLLKDPELPNMLSELKSLKSDQLLFKRIKAYMQRRQSPGAVITKAMVYSQFQDVHSFLIGKGRFKVSLRNGFENVTLVGSWLNHMKKMFSDNTSKFTGEFFRLNNQINTILLSRNKGKPIQYSSIPKMKDNSATVYILERITSKEFNKTEHNYEWSEACLSLKGLYTLWDKADTYLKSIEYFCESIQDIRDPEMNQDIVNTCFGSLDIRKSRSWLQDAQNYFLQINGPSQQGSVVEDTLVKLRCELPAKP